MSKYMSVIIAVATMAWQLNDFAHGQAATDNKWLYAIEVYVEKTPQGVCEPGIHCFECSIDHGEMRIAKNPEKHRLDFDEAWWFQAYPEFRKAMGHVVLPERRRLEEPDQALTATIVIDFDAVGGESFFPDPTGVVTPYHFPVVLDGKLFLAKERDLHKENQIIRSSFVLQDIDSGEETEASKDLFRHVLKGEALTLNERGELRFDRFGFQEVVLPHRVPEGFSEPFAKFGVVWNDGDALILSSKRSAQGGHGEKVIVCCALKRDAPCQVYTIKGETTSTVYRQPWLLNRVRYLISWPPRPSDYTGEWIVIDTRDDWSTRFELKLGQTDELVGHTDRYLFFRKEDSLVSVDLKSAREQGTVTITTLYTGECVRNFRAVFEASKQRWPPANNDQ